MGNQTDYFFALDPERANLLHLYPVWARLQEAEIAAVKSPGNAPLRERLEAAASRAASTGKSTCRIQFEPRAGRDAAYFDDPWWDGSAYSGTIVCTPNRGTLLGPAGVRSDLGDDPVAEIVEQELTDPIFGPEFLLLEWSTRPEPTRRRNPFRLPRCGMCLARRLTVTGSCGLGSTRGSTWSRGGLPCRSVLNFGGISTRKTSSEFLPTLNSACSCAPMIGSPSGAAGASSSPTSRRPARRVDGLQQGFLEICSVVRQMHDLMRQMQSGDPAPNRTVARSEAILFELVECSRSLRARIGRASAVLRIKPAG